MPEYVVYLKRWLLHRANETSPSLYGDKSIIKTVTLPFPPFVGLAIDSTPRSMDYDDPIEEIAWREFDETFSCWLKSVVAQDQAYFDAVLQAHLDTGWAEF